MKSHWKKLRYLLASLQSHDQLALSKVCRSASSEFIPKNYVTFVNSRVRLMAIYERRSRNKRLHAEGFSTTLNNLKEASLDTIRLHGFTLPNYDYTIFTDPGIENLFGIIAIPFEKQ